MSAKFIEEMNFNEKQENNSKENRFIIIELQSANNNNGQEFWIAKVNPLEIRNMGSFCTSSFTPFICEKTRKFIFPSSLEKYLIYLLNKKKPITIDENIAEKGYLDGKVVLIINSLENDANFEKFYELPFACQECRLTSPNCYGCEYNSCCLRCEYINSCNR